MAISISPMSRFNEIINTCIITPQFVIGFDEHILIVRHSDKELPEQPYPINMQVFKNTSLPAPTLSQWFIGAAIVPISFDDFIEAARPAQPHLKICKTEKALERVNELLLEHVDQRCTCILRVSIETLECGYDDNIRLKIFKEYENNNCCSKGMMVLACCIHNDIIHRFPTRHHLCKLYEVDEDFLTTMHNIWRLFGTRRRIFESINKSEIFKNAFIIKKVLTSNKHLSTIYV